MEISDLYDYCLSKKGVTEHFPFDQDTLVFKIGGKIFVLASLSKWEKGQKTFNVKCNPELAMEQRAIYDAVAPGFHMNKKHWNTINTQMDMPFNEILKSIDHSYELVFGSLPQKVKNEIELL
ncbi:MAG: MmcQ/YjbR family DNA-binding protein [Flavobacterium sp.]